MKTHLLILFAVAVVIFGTVVKPIIDAIFAALP
jgi:hypothetical protein